MAGLLTLVSPGLTTGRNTPFRPDTPPPAAAAACSVLDEGLLPLRKVEAVATGPNNRPKLPCAIAECGEM